MKHTVPTANPDHPDFKINHLSSDSMTVWAKGRYICTIKMLSANPTPNGMQLWTISSENGGSITEQNLTKAARAALERGIRVLDRHYLDFIAEPFVVELMARSGYALGYTVITRDDDSPNPALLEVLTAIEAPASQPTTTKPEPKAKKSKATIKAARSSSERPVFKITYLDDQTVEVWADDEVRAILNYAGRRSNPNLWQVVDLDGKPWGNDPKDGLTRAVRAGLECAWLKSRDAVLGSDTSGPIEVRVFNRGGNDLGTVALERDSLPVGLILQVLSSGPLERAELELAKLEPGLESAEPVKVVHPEISSSTDELMPVDEPAPEAPESSPAPVGVTAIPLERLMPSKLNPRKSFDPVKLEELAASILEKGILQNLVVRPAGDRLEIACGERRYRAAMLLVDQGKWTLENLVPVSIRELSDLELLALATTENVQRSEMTALEEAEAFASLHAMGMSQEEISLRVGKSLGTVGKRVALATRLCPEVKRALETGRITLSIAQAFTIGDFDRQKQTLKNDVPKDGIRNGYPSAANIRNAMVVKCLAVRFARFKPEQYKGEIIEDLFGNIEPYYADAGQAQKLQLEAVAAMKAKLEKKWASVIVAKSRFQFSGSYLSDGDRSRYMTKSSDKSKASAIITIQETTLEVKVFEGYIEVKNSGSSGTQASKAATADRKEKAKADLQPEQVIPKLTKILKTDRSVHLTDLALKAIMKLPKRDPEATRLDRVTKLGEYLVNLERYDRSVRRPLARTELIAQLENGPAMQSYTVPVANASSIESNITFWVLVRPGELRIGLYAYGVQPDAGLPEHPEHAQEILHIADVLEASTATGKNEDLIRALDAARALV